MSSLMDKAKEFVADKIAQMPKPEASLASVSIKSFTRDSILFHSEVAVLNPYSHSIPICQLSYALKSAGREVASGTMPDPGSLTASAETKLEVSVKVGLTIDLPIIGDFTIPLSTKGEIKLPTLSDLFCGGGGGGGGGDD
ncbi:hypothetical protein OPV22_008438 [Ensete ventricosum]|uniref:Water stress and hypersensitive response domain-containing protein n=1 Tax=Ensete ventricosum TaxID=4639 RepID=A0AAV8RCR6_ENSVE|nr:hypothetical protein OPV22_008438 [Ensete ventricosum]